MSLDDNLHTNAPHHTPGPLASFKANVDKLKTLTRYLALNCLSEINKVFFDGSKAPSRRLSPLAIIQNSPSIRALPVIVDNTAKLIT